MPAVIVFIPDRVAVTARDRGVIDSTSLWRPVGV